MTRVLVIGASHGIGLECVRRALAAGHHVRAFARSANKIAIEDARLEKIAGDALAGADVASAVAGVDAVIQSLGVAPSLAAVTLFSQATRMLVDAMQAHGVRRLLAVTGLGAGDSRGHGGLLYDFVVMPLFLKRIYNDKDVQEQIIRASRLDWTIARPGYLTNKPATGNVRVLLEPKDWRAASITRADVAEFLVQQIADPTLVGKSPVLVNAH